MTHPVEAWKYHDISDGKLPMCWLLHEYDSPDNFTAFVFDGNNYRFYQGLGSEGMRHLPQVEVHGRRLTPEEDAGGSDGMPADDGRHIPREKAGGVELLVRIDGIVESCMMLPTSERELGYVTLNWPRWYLGVDSTSHPNSPAGAHCSIEPYRISITPDIMFVMPRSSTVKR